MILEGMWFQNVELSICPGLIVNSPCTAAFGKNQPFLTIRQVDIVRSSATKLIACKSVKNLL